MELAFRMGSRTGYSSVISGGFFIHTRDNNFRYKALMIGSKTDPYILGFDSEAYGPLDNNLAAGGLSWRINAYKGDWHIPAERYREWLWNTFDLKNEEEKEKTMDTRC